MAYSLLSHDTLMQKLWRLLVPQQDSKNQTNYLKEYQTNE